MDFTWIVVVTGLLGTPPYTFHPEPSAPDCHRRMVHINQTYRSVRARCVVYAEARQLGFDPEPQEAARRPERLP